MILKAFFIVYGEIKSKETNEILESPGGIRVELQESATQP
jgi:hypothetical protein